MSEDNSPTKFDLYKIALETRNMEIALFWQRSNYFLALNTAVAVGFFIKAGEDYQVLIGIFGVVISVLWFGINLGSKFWQSRWEWQVKKAEEELNKLESMNIGFFSAPWETIKDDVEESLKFSKHGKIRKLFDRLILCKPSVSFIMTILSVFFILFWLGLIIAST